MKKTILTLKSLLIMVIFCQTTVAQVKSDYDKEADFSKYKTYTFEGWQDNSDKIMNEFDKKRLLDAFRSEFSNKGMEAVESDGDVMLTLFIVVNEKSSTTAYTNFNGGMGYGGRWGWGYGSAGMGSATTTYTESDYKEGTLVIDMYDSESKQLVWQGVMISTVNENPKKREKSIPKKVRKLMKKYPPKK